MPKPTPLNRVPAGSARRFNIVRVFLAFVRSYTKGQRLSLPKFSRAASGFSGFALALIALSTFMVFKPASTSAATNSTINFQARLESISGAIAPDGNYNVEFKLYSASTGGTALWTEDYLNSASQGIHTTNGYLTTSLGSVTAFPTTINWDQQLYLTMNIGGTSTGSPTWDGEMNPRLALTAVPYAFRAGSLATYNSTSGYTSTLSVAPTSTAQTFTVPDQGSTGSYTLLTSQAASTSFVQSQSGIGSPQANGFNVGGTGSIGGALNVSGVSTLGGNLYVTGTSDIGIGTSSPGAALQIKNPTSSQIAQIIQGAASQSVDLLDFSDSNSIVESKFTSGGQLTLGTIASSGTVYQGKLTFGDGTADGKSLTLQVGNGSTSLSNTTVITIPTTSGASDTLCLLSLGNCVVNVGGLDGGTANANGATVSLNTLYLQSASSSYAGLVNTASQTLAGAKTFSGQLTAGLATGNSLVVTSSASIGNSLTVGTSGTTPGVINLATSGSTVSLQSSSQSNTIIFTFPTDTASTDVICIQNKGNCTGSSAGSGDPNYLYNAYATTSLVQQTANIDLISSNTGVVTATLQAASSGTADILDIINASGTLASYFDKNGSLNVGTSANNTSVGIGSVSATPGQSVLNVGLGNSTGTGGYDGIDISTSYTRSGGPTGKAINISNTNGTVAKLDYLGNLTLGKSGTGGGPYPGNVFLADGTGDSYFADFASAALANNETYLLPSIGGTICVEGSSGPSSCTDSGLGFIQNQTSSPQAGGFDVAGNGILGGNLTASGTITGTTAITSSGNITASGVYYDGSTAGVTATCSGGQLLQNQTVAGGITTGGTCAAVSGSGSGVTTVGALDGGGAANSLGATIVSNTLYLQSASGTNPGVVNTTTQSFAGNKTFTGNLSVTGTLTVTSLATASAGLKIGVGATGESAAQVLTLDNGTTSTEPTGVTGAMYYSTYYNEYRCYTEGQWESCRTQPIDQSYEIDEEFLTGATTTPTTAASGGIGNYNWSSNTVGGTSCSAYTYAGGSSGAAITGSRPGILTFKTAATSGTGCRIDLSPLGTANTSIVNPGQDIKTSVAVGAATNANMRVGLDNGTTALAQSTTGGVWWEAVSGTNANWEYCYATGSAATCAASGVAIAANTFVRLEIRVVSSSSVVFTINGTSTTLTGITLGTTAVAPTALCYATAATAENCYVDYYQFRGDDSSLR